jgi:hypothetical protein
LFSFFEPPGAGMVPVALRTPSTMRHKLIPASEIQRFLKDTLE